ncbi:MAG: endo alpha-1,4 polygalactosaminidase [Ectobacillus sp.]
MKTMKYAFVCLVLAVTSLFQMQAASAAAPNILDGQGSYKIYYGAPNNRILAQLGSYDFVIIEPYHYSSEQIKQIQENGTLVFGYISTMEAANWNTVLMAKMEPGDFFYRGGEKVRYTQWDSYLMDIASVHYRQVLMDEIKMQIAEKGFDGIFLDTVGDIDDEHGNNITVLNEQRQGMKELLEGIKQQYPSMALIQNWGFETLKTTTAPYVNAIMWENFNYRAVAKDAWSLNRIKDLQQLQQSYGLEVLTVSFAQQAQSAQFAKKHGFIHYHAGRGYDRW